MGPKNNACDMFYQRHERFILIMSTHKTNVFLEFKVDPRSSSNMEL